MAGPGVRRRHRARGAARGHPVRLLLLPDLAAAVHGGRPRHLHVRPACALRRRERFRARPGALLSGRPRRGRPPLLLVHGFGASSATFRELAPRLRDAYTLIAPDLLGHGFSDRADEAASHDAQALLMLELLERLGIERAAVLGHSMGTSVAL